jgi:hypothetical protein
VAAGFLDMVVYLALPLSAKVELRWSGGYSLLAARLLLLFRREKKPMIYVVLVLLCSLHLIWLADGGQLLAVRGQGGFWRRGQADVAFRGLAICYSIAIAVVCM